MKIVGLTGGIATGKSTVARMLCARSVPVIDADRIARRIMREGTPAFKRVVEMFGNEVLDHEGNIDREKLGKRIFCDKEARVRLNKSTHRYILLEMMRELFLHFWRRAQIVVLDVPLLFETNLHWLCNTVWVVTADFETQVKRVMARDGHDRNESIRRIRAQMPIEEKIRRADVVLDNSATLDTTEEQVDKVLADVTPSVLRIHFPQTRSFFVSLLLALFLLLLLPAYPWISRRETSPPQ